MTVSVTICAKGWWSGVRAMLYPGDIVAELAGGELAILCEDIEGAEEAGRIAHRFTAEASRPLALGGELATPMVSTGVAVGGGVTARPPRCLPTPAPPCNAPGSGPGSHVELFNERLRVDLLTRIRSLNGFARGIDDANFRLVYQPIIAIDDGRLVAAEALLRWDKVDPTLASVHEIISLAEETDWIEPLGRWVLRAACRQAAAWTQSSPDPLVTYVNVSPKQLIGPTLVTDVEQALSKEGLEPSRLGLEVTESGMVSDQAIAVLQRLHALGVRLSLDDFGTGFSCLSSLQRLPLDNLKLDRSFVAGLSAGSSDASIVTTIVSLADEALQALDVRDIWVDASLREQHEDLLQSQGVIIGFEEELVHFTGRTIWVHDSVQLVRDIDGSALFYEGALIDITARKRVIEALEHSEERYRTLFHPSPVPLSEEDFSALAVWLDDLRSSGVTDLRGYLAEHPKQLRWGIDLIRIVDVNQATIDLVGAATKEQLLGAIPTEVLTPDVLQAYLEQIMAVWEGRRRLSIEYVGQTFAGNRIDCLLDWVVAPGGEGTNLSRAVVAVTDVTEQRRNEERLIDMVPDPVFVFRIEEGPRFRCAAANTAALTATGFGEDAVVGRLLEEIVPPEEAALSSERFKAAMQVDVSIRSDRTIELPAGRLCFQITTAAIRDEGGSYTHIVISLSRRHRSQGGEEASGSRGTVPHSLQLRPDRYGPGRDRRAIPSGQLGDGRHARTHRGAVDGSHLDGFNPPGRPGSEPTSRQRATDRCDRILHIGEALPTGRRRGPMGEAPRLSRPGLPGKSPVPDLPAC